MKYELGFYSKKERSFSSSPSFYSGNRPSTTSQLMMSHSAS